MTDDLVRLPAPASRDDIRPRPEDVAAAALARVAELEAERDRLALAIVRARDVLVLAEDGAIGAAYHELYLGADPTCELTDPWREVEEWAVDAALAGGEK
jgi:hypothetical protein